MPKYLLLKHYRGGPEPHHPFPPMDQWAPEDVEAHMAFLRNVKNVLGEHGEYVDAQALTPTRTWVRYGGPDAAPVTTDGPHPETSELIAGWFMIDVDSRERALEIAAYVSSEPGPGGAPLYEWLDVREVMSGAPGGGLTGGGSTSRHDRWTVGRAAPRRARPRSRRCSPAWSGGARTSTPPRTRCRRRSWRPSGSGPSISPLRRGRVAGHGRDPAARRRPPQRGRPTAPRGADAHVEPRPAAAEVEGDDTLFLLFCCCHPELAPCLPGGVDPPRRRRPHDPGDRGRLLRSRRRRWRSGSAGPSARCAAVASTNPATSPSSCACCTSSTRRGTLGPPTEVDLAARGDPPRPPAHPRH